MYIYTNRNTLDQSTSGCDHVPLVTVFMHHKHKRRHRQTDRQTDRLIDTG